MDAGNKTFDEFVTGRNKFEIPDFQRNYSWGESQLSDLWRDLNNVSLGKKHYYGTFLLMQKEDSTSFDGQSYDIIDGQQRLTSILILLNELSKALHKYDEDLAEEIREWYIVKRDRYKLTLMGEDEDFFKDYVLDTADKPHEYPDETITPSQRRLKHAKQFFHDKLKKKDEEMETEEFEKYCREMKNKIQSLDLMVYPVESKPDAVLIFEVVNDRGKGLSDLEKTKSFLMHQLYLSIDKEEPAVLEEKLNTIQRRFGEIYQLIEEINEFESLKEDRIQRFHYIVWDDSWTSSRDKKYYQDYLSHLKKELRGMTPDTRVKEILNYTEDLRNSFHVIKDLFKSNINPGVKERLTRLFMIGRVANFYPILIATWLKYKEGKFNPDDLKNLLDKMETYIFRVYSVKQKPGNTGRTKFYRLARDIHKGRKTASQAVSQMEKHIHEYCDDEDLKNTLKTKNLYKYYGDSRKNELRYLLYFYEKKLEDELEGLNLDLKEIVKNENENITIEHIWPQNPDRLNLSDEERKKHESCKHRLGNLALMTGSWNTEQSNQAPNKKKQKYLDSRIRMLNEVANDLDEWGEDKIKEREEKILETVLERWS